MRNEYAGFRLHSAGRLRAVSPTIGARRFYERFVATRTPVLVRGLLPELAQASQRWLNGGLERAAGGRRVSVELRGSTAEPFGRGNRVEMSFASLLQTLASGDTSHYMTTQPLPTLHDGSEDLVAPPLDTIRSELPMRPSLLPTLQLQSVNMWVGRASADDGVAADDKDEGEENGDVLALAVECKGGGAVPAVECEEDGAVPHRRGDIAWPARASTKRRRSGGASSGLHHDHHDNLLCLLRGTKVRGPRRASVACMGRRLARRHFYVYLSLFMHARRVYNFCYAGHNVFCSSKPRSHPPLTNLSTYEQLPLVTSILRLYIYAYTYT